jgi:predicted nucleotidyltransferase
VSVSRANENTIASATRPAALARAVARAARGIFGDELEVYWFGSWPRGKARPHSDIDIGLMAAAPLALAAMARLREAIEDLPTLYSVDIVDLGVVREELRASVVRHGVRL